MEATNNAVELIGVSRRFGQKKALDNVNLAVPAGSVLGLVGENGAGKTTLIKHVMGLLSPQTGRVVVVGGDPVADPRGVLSRVGYLSENADLPTWMRVHELMRYTQSFYATWDAAYAEALRVEFGLDLRAKLRELSKGQRARAGLLVALAYRPDLLVLDEPSSGLDPIVRRDILSAIIRTIAEEGRTVLFSSHLLSEVEQVADRVALMREGRIVFDDELDAIKERHHRVTLRWPGPLAAAPTVEGAFGWTGEGCEWTTIWCGDGDRIEGIAAAAGSALIDRSSPSLDEIFVARVGSPLAAARAQ